MGTDGAVVPESPVPFNTHVLNPSQSTTPETKKVNSKKSKPLTRDHAPHIGAVVGLKGTHTLRQGD